MRIGVRREYRGGRFVRTQNRYQERGGPITIALAPLLVVGIIESYTKQGLHKLYAETCKKYNHTWKAEESNAYVRIVWKESTGNPNCTTSRSSSAGLFGFLRGTRKRYGVTLNDPHVVQSDAFIRYCIGRYGSIMKALEFHRRRGYYKICISLKS